MVEKAVITIINSILPTKKIKGLGGGGYGKKQRGFPRAVDEPVPAIEWRRKDASFAPFEALFCPTFLPDLGAASSLQDDNNLLVKMFFRIQ